MSQICSLTLELAALRGLLTTRAEGATRGRAVSSSAGTIGSRVQLASAKGSSSSHKVLQGETRNVERDLKGDRGSQVSKGLSAAFLREKVAKSE